MVGRVEPAKSSLPPDSWCNITKISVKRTVKSLTRVRLFQFIYFSPDLFQLLLFIRDTNLFVKMEISQDFWGVSLFYSNRWYLHAGEQLTTILQRSDYQLIIKKVCDILMDTCPTPMLSIVTKETILGNFWSIMSCCKEPGFSDWFLKLPCIFWLLRQLLMKPETQLI